MTTQKKNSRLSVLAILCQTFCLLIAFTVVLLAPFVMAENHAHQGAGDDIFTKAKEFATTWGMLILTAIAVWVAYQSQKAAKRSADESGRSAIAAERSASATEGALQHEKKMASKKLVVDALNRVSEDKELLKLTMDIKGNQIEIMAGWMATKMILYRLISQLTIVVHARDRGLVDDGDLCTVLYDLLKVIDDDAVRYDMGLDLQKPDSDFPKFRKRLYKMLLELADHCFSRPN